MQNRNKRLDEYFKAARQQEPVVSLEKVQAQLQQKIASSANVAGKGASVLSSKTISVMVTSVISAVFLGILLWGNPEEKKLLQPESPVEATTGEAQQDVPAITKDVQAVATPDTTVSKVKAGVPKSSVTSKPKLPNVQAPTGKSIGSETKSEPVAASGQAVPAVQTEAAPVFDNIKLVELPKETLEKLQIQVFPEGIHYYNVVADATNSEGKNLVLQLSVVNNVHRVVLGAIQSAPTTTPFLPVFISERSGKQRVAYRLPNETKRKFERAYFNEMINSLVPVLIKANNATKDEVILWFEPTPAFLSLLPPSVSAEIDKEYKLLLESRDATKQLAKADSSILKAGNVKPQPDKEAEKRVASEALLNTSYKYFESGVSNLTTIKYAVVYPNPAKEYVKLTIGLKRDETLRVSLVDINGRLVKVLSPYKAYTVGSTTEEFNIQGTLPGLYLVVTETKSGSRLSQRIIIQ